jgi:hypothetical protein
MSNDFPYRLASINVGVIFYYYDANGHDDLNGNMTFLLQEQTQNTDLDKGSISITGCYVQHTVKNNLFEQPHEAIWRKIAEANGEEFRNALNQEDFALHNVVKIRPTVEPDPNGNEKANYHLIWLVKISRETAKLACVAGTHEVSKVVHVRYTKMDSLKNRLAPWFVDTVKELETRECFKKYVRTGTYGEAIGGTWQPGTNY